MSAPAATDHRRIQRTLFRMQMDPGFARAVLAGEPAALASTGLSAADLGLVRTLDPAGVAADPEGKRRLQVLGNVAAEFTTTLALCAAAGSDPLATFPTSEPFHEAVRGDGSLPLALAAHLEGAAGASARVEAVLALETALARARRTAGRSARPPAGHVVLAARATLVELPAGTLETADGIRARVAQGGLPAAGEGGPAPPGRETVLIHARDAADARPWLSLGPRGTPDLSVERLVPPSDRLLRSLERPADRAARARLAGELGATPEELEAFVAELLAEGVLEAGA